MSQLLIQNKHGVILVHFQATTFLDQNVVSEVGRELNDMIDKTEAQKIVVDLGRVELMTSSMIGEFVKFKKSCDEHKIQLALCNLSGELAKLFKMTRLNKVFKIYDTREKALKAMK